MKKKLFVILTALSILVPWFSMPASQVYAEEFLPNPGFESVSSGRPTQWTQLNAAVPVITESATVAEGVYGIKLTDGSNTSATGLRSSLISVTPGAIYQASIAAKVDSGQPLLYMEFYNASGQRTVQTAFAYPSPDWQTMIVQGFAPADAVSASLLISSGVATVGNAYFDSASLRIVTPDELQILNPGFEKVNADGTPQQWTQQNPALPATASELLVRTGNRSARLVDPDAASPLGLRSSKMPVTPGTGYEAKINFYAIAGTPSMYLEFWNSGGQRISTQIQSSSVRNEWTEMSLQGTAPATAVAATILIYGSGSNVGTTYFDDASLTTLSAEPVHTFNQAVAGYPRLFFTENDLPALQARAQDATIPPYGSSGQELWGKIQDAADSYLAESSMTLKYYNNYEVTYPLLGDQLLSNPGFEQLSSGFPLLWYNFNNNQPVTTVTSHVYSGNNAILVSDPNTTNQPGLRSAKVPVTPGKAYQASVYAYIETGSPLLYLEFWNSANERILVKTQAAPASSGWQLITVQGAAPAEAATASIILYSSTINVGNAYFDDASLRALLPKQPAPLGPPPGFTAGNYPYWTSLAMNMQTRIETLSLAYAISGNEAYADRAKSYMLALSYWKDWTDVTMGCGETCQDTIHFVLAVSAGYDILYNRFTAAERLQIETALENKGVKPLYNDLIARIDTNLQISRAAALASASLVLLGKSPDANKYLTRATNYFEWYMDERMMSGQNEGFQYSSYSIENVIKAVDQITRVTGETDIMEHALIDDFLVRWSLYFLAPGGLGQAAFSDSLYMNHYPISMRVVNERLGNGYAGWYLREASPATSVFSQFLYYNSDGLISNPESLPSSVVLDEIGWAALRSGWGENDTLLAFTSNNSGFGHNHMDQNSFQIATGGSWIARDPGYQDFSAGPTNDFTLKFGHSTIRVDGQGQNGLGGGKLTAGILSPAYDYVKGSAAGTYVDLQAEQPILNRFDRHIVYIKPYYYVLMDDLRADDPHAYEWTLFSGPLFDSRFDNQPAVTDATYSGNSIYLQNGTSQLSALFLGDEPLPMTITKHPGAEKYGYVTKAGSGAASENHRFLTVLKAAPFDGQGYYQESDIIPMMSSSGKPYYVDKEGGVNHMIYEADAAGDYVSFPVTVSTDGFYRFSTAFMAKPKYGQVQAFVDGQPVGNVFNGSFFASIPAATEEHGLVYLTAGMHTIRYEVVENTASNYMFAIDAVQLVPADGLPPIDASMQISASLMPGGGDAAIGAAIERTDGSGFTDYVVFKTGNTPYTIGDLAGDADQAIVTQGVNGAIEGYSMTRGTQLMYDGQALLEATLPFQASFTYDSALNEMKGQLEVQGATAYSMYVPSVSAVKIDGSTLSGSQYAYHAATKTLTFTLTSGKHSVVVEG